MIVDFITLLGGVAVFILGLGYISEGADKIAESKIGTIIGKGARNRFSAAAVGGLFSAVAQSSVAVNVISLSFVEKGIISLLCCCAVVIGTNLGTTVTAQIVSLRYISGINVTALGAFFAVCGIISRSSKHKKFNFWGSLFLGFGLIFIGIEFMCAVAVELKNYSVIQSLFTIKCRPILLLNGFFITALCQSSSVVTSVLVIFAGEGVLAFSDAVFLIMGANIGACIPVVWTAIKKGEKSFSIALFNVLFNTIAMLIFYILFEIFPDFFTSLFQRESCGRAIADFHTFFNLSFGVLALAFLNPLNRLSQKISKFFLGKSRNLDNSGGKSEKKKLKNKIKQR